MDVRGVGGPPRSRINTLFSSKKKRKTDTFKWIDNPRVKDPVDKLVSISPDNSLHNGLRVRRFLASKNSIPASVSTKFHVKIFPILDKVPTSIMAKISLYLDIKFVLTKLRPVCKHVYIATNQPEVVEEKLNCLYTKEIRDWCSKHNGDACSIC